MTSVVCPECGYNAGDKPILDLHLSVTGHSLNPGPKPPLSGFYACSRHPELPPMTMTEFENHKTTRDIANNSEKSYNVQKLGLIGLWKNTKIQPCQMVSIPEGDTRLRLVPAVQGTQGYTVVKEVIREVLVTCRHCGARYPQGTPKCLTCGANL